MVTNLSGGDLNCSPRPYTFEVTAATQAYAPDTYRWTITDITDGNVVDEQTVAGSQPTFSYTLTNNGVTARQFRVRLQPEKSTLCFESVEKVVTVNPVPASSFTVEQTAADCEWVTYQATAEQSGVFYPVDSQSVAHQQPRSHQGEHHAGVSQAVGRGQRGAVIPENYQSG